LQRYYQTRAQDQAGPGYGYAPPSYTPPSYGPPPSWRRDWRDYPPPPPPPRWYRPGMYGSW